MPRPHPRRLGPLRSRARLVAPLVAALLGACAAGRTAPPAGTPAAEAAAAGADAATAGRAADIRFMQDMIVHHEQALAMTALVPGRATRDEIRLMAQRMDVSQQDEIATMRRWLRSRGVTADSAAAHAGHGGEHPRMPGMASAEEMRRLREATGAAFDRLFLELMIRHHEGALEMVRTLLATPRSAQDSELFGIAADVDADQRAEIARMRRLLATLPSATPGR